MCPVHLHWFAKQVCFWLGRVGLAAPRTAGGIKGGSGLKVGEGDKRQGWEGSLGGGGKAGEVADERLQSGSWLCCNTTGGITRECGRSERQELCQSRSLHGMQRMNVPPVPWVCSGTQSLALHHWGIPPAQSASESCTPISQTLPKRSFSSFFPQAPFPWPCSWGKAAALGPF